MKFLERLEQLYTGAGADSWRKKSWERFLELGLPRISSEAFQYVPLSKLYEMEPEAAVSAAFEKPPILPECDSYLVFVDGHFQPEHSKIPAGVIALPMTAAMKSYGLFLQNRIGKTLKEESDPFAALNGALQGTGLFLYVPPKTILEKPIQIAHVSTGKHFTSPRIQLYVGKMGSIQIAQTFSGHFSNTVVDCVLDEAAQAKIYDASLPNPDAWQMQALRATLKRDSRLETFLLTKGSKTVRTSFRVQLAEENSEALIRGISLLDDESQSHIHGLVEHLAPGCRSRQHFKSILRGESRSSFEGKIFVKPIAQKTEAYQSSQNLILSDKANANAKPNLEIFADDVKASHGATFAQPSAEDIFYLRSRGLSLSEAKEMLVRGFCREMLDTIPFASMREVL
ncbi:MAG: Fe-S cluster assembly protein SufD [Verrucomicrobia bacterium]|nr:Fe-S cluster assembly protein SufD [Verrucomicrobiota bacterium]